MCITLLPPLPGHLLSGRSHALCGWTQKPGCLACHNIPSNCKTQVTEERSPGSSHHTLLLPGLSLSLQRTPFQTLVPQQF